MGQSDSGSAEHRDEGQWASARDDARVDESLPSFLHAALGDGRVGLRPHVDLNLGGFDEPSLEPVLFALLGVTPECRLRLGISWQSPGDLAACRAEWGEPCESVDLRRGTRSPLCWDIWVLPADTLIGENVAGSSLVLEERDPRWILYTDPDEGIPMLFPVSRACPVHP